MVLSSRSSSSFQSRACKVHSHLTATFVDFINTDVYTKVVPLHAQNAGTWKVPDCHYTFWHRQYVKALLDLFKSRPSIILHHMATKQQSNQKDTKWQKLLHVLPIALSPSVSVTNLITEMWDVTNMTISAFFFTSSSIQAFNTYD